MIHTIEVFTLLLVVGVAMAQDTGVEQGKSGMALYGIEVQTIDGRSTTLEEWRGKLLMIVNVASKCGFTSQYEGLQKLYDTYRDRGFVILGFPSNDFLGQEPGSDEDIKQFCTLNYGVNFPMFSKIRVKGKEQHALYRYLTDKKTNPQHGGKIAWNFNKFLVGSDGQIVARFGSRTEPGDAAVQEAIEAHLP